MRWLGPFIALCLLAACGQSGDLYLPDSQPAATGQAQPAPPADAEKDKKESR